MCLPQEGHSTPLRPLAGQRTALPLSHAVYVPRWRMCLRNKRPPPSPHSPLHHATCACVQMARNVKQDEDGFVRDLASCEEFDADGNDNGATPASIVADEFDWHVGASGLYALRDIQWLRYVGINNDAAVYWKTSKAMADGKSAHIKDSIIGRIANLYPGANARNGHMMGPSGAFTFVMDNVTFLREDSDSSSPPLKIGQHCGLSGHNGGVEGQMCAVQYFLRNMDWSHISSEMQRIQFGVSGGNPITPILTAADESLDGAQSLISPLLGGFAALPGCHVTTLRWSYATACADRARRLQIFGHPMWNDESRGLPMGGGADIPWELRTTGVHTYNGSEGERSYYIRCAFNGCRPWNRVAYEEAEVGVARNWTTAMHQFAYGQLRLRGPGYDGVVPSRVHMRSEWPPQLFESILMNGVNGGWLTYDATGSGYAAVVLEGRNYTLEGADPSVDLAIVLSDPWMAALTPDKPDEVLALCVAGGGPFQRSGVLDAACWLGGQDSRRWLRVKGGLQATRGDLRYEKPPNLSKSPGVQLWCS